MKPGYERSEREAVERLDILEDLLPRACCQVRGCSRTSYYAWAGAFGTRWLCARHRPLYREHDRLLRKIRSIPPRDAI